jgi:ParB/RepB/Spo0J family partition protein
MTYKNTDVDISTPELLYLRPDQISFGPYQPRKVDSEEALNDLAESFISYGIQEPVKVKKDENGRFVLVFGHRRLEAAKRAMEKSNKEILIPALLIRNIEEGNILELSLVENIHREDLCPVDLADALMKLKKQKACSDKDLQQIIGKKRSTISEILGIDKLPKWLKEEVRGLWKKGIKVSQRQLIRLSRCETEEEMKEEFEKIKTIWLKTASDPSTKKWRKYFHTPKRILKLKKEGIYIWIRYVPTERKLAEIIKSLCSLIIDEAKKTNSDDLLNSIFKNIEDIIFSFNEGIK